MQKSFDLPLEQSPVLRQGPAEISAPLVSSTKRADFKASLLLWKGCAVLSRDPLFPRSFVVGCPAHILGIVDGFLLVLLGQPSRQNLSRPRGVVAAGEEGGGGGR